MTGLGTRNAGVAGEAFVNAGEDTLMRTTIAFGIESRREQRSLEEC